MSLSRQQPPHQASSKYSSVGGLSSSGRGNIIGVNQGNIIGGNSLSGGGGTSILFVPSKIAMLLRPNGMNISSNGGISNGMGMSMGVGQGHGQGQYTASTPGLEYAQHQLDRIPNNFYNANITTTTTTTTHNRITKEDPTTTTTTAAKPKHAPSYSSGTFSSHVANTHPLPHTTEVSSNARKTKDVRSTTPSATKRNTPGGKRVAPGRPTNHLNDTTSAAAITTTATTTATATAPTTVTTKAVTAAIKTRPNNDMTNHPGQKGLVNKVRQLQRIKAIERIQSFARGYIARSKVVALRRQRLFEERQKMHHQVMCSRLTSFICLMGLLSSPTSISYFLRLTKLLLTSCILSIIRLPSPFKNH